MEESKRAGRPGGATGRRARADAGEPFRLGPSVLCKGSAVRPAAGEGARGGRPRSVRLRSRSRMDYDEMMMVKGINSHMAKYTNAPDVQAYV